MGEESQNVAEEIQASEVVHSENQTQESPVSQEERGFSKEDNFVRLRETKQQLERENRELKQALLRSSKAEETEDNLSIEDDDLVDGRVVKKLYSEIKTLRKSYEQEKLSSIPDRLRSKFSDFDQVVTQENIEKLKNNEPELYSSITSGSDLYAKGVAAYKTLKSLGLVEKDPYEEEKRIVKQNHSKPVSVQAIKGQSALSDANIFAKGLTPDLKKHLQEEMEQAIKAR